MQITLRDLESSEEVAIDASGATLGRSGEVLIQDRSVSSRHARIHFDGGHWLLEDLGSSNGTYVDGARLEAPLELAGGMQFSLARHRFEVLEAPESDELDPASQPTGVDLDKATLTTKPSRRAGSGPHSGGGGGASANERAEVSVSKTKPVQDADPAASGGAHAESGAGSSKAKVKAGGAAAPQVKWRLLIIVLGVIAGAQVLGAILQRIRYRSGADTAEAIAAVAAADAATSADAATAPTGGSATTATTTGTATTTTAPTTAGSGATAATTGTATTTTTTAPTTAGSGAAAATTGTATPTTATVPTAAGSGAAAATTTTAPAGAAAGTTPPSGTAATTPTGGGATTATSPTTAGTAVGTTSAATPTTAATPGTPTSGTSASGAQTLPPLQPSQPESMPAPIGGTSYPDFVARRAAVEDAIAKDSSHLKKKPVRDAYRDLRKKSARIEAKYSKTKKRKKAKSDDAAEAEALARQRDAALFKGTVAVVDKLYKWVILGQK